VVDFRKLREKMREVERGKGFSSKNLFPVSSIQEETSPQESPSLKEEKKEQETVVPLPVESFPLSHPVGEVPSPLGERTSSIQGAESPPPNYLLIVVGKGYYALPLKKVEEVVKAKNLTRVPRVPGWVKGVMSLRGSMIPVVHLGLRLGKGEEGVPKEGKILIVEEEGERCGLLVDEVVTVFSVRDQETISSQEKKKEGRVLGDTLKVPAEILTRGKEGKKVSVSGEIVLVPVIEVSELLSVDGEGG
jgi:purine-binding chemotaxis protein CheW